MCFISSSKSSGSVKMSRLQRKLPVASFSSTEASRRSSTLPNMVILPVAASPLRCLPNAAALAARPRDFRTGASVRRSVGAVDDGGGCARDFLSDGKIKLDVGIGLVQTGLVDGSRIADARHRREQGFPGGAPPRVRRPPPKNGKDNTGKPLHLVFPMPPLCFKKKNTVHS